MPRTPRAEPAEPAGRPPRRPGRGAGRSVAAAGALAAVLALTSCAGWSATATPDLPGSPSATPTAPRAPAAAPSPTTPDATPDAILGASPVVALVLPAHVSATERRLAATVRAAAARADLRVVAVRTPPGTTFTDVVPDDAWARTQAALTVPGAIVVGVGPRTLEALDATSAANLGWEFVLVGATPDEPTDNLLVVDPGHTRAGAHPTTDAVEAALARATATRG